MNNHRNSFPTGEWVLWRENDISIVLEVDQFVAYAYLWSKVDGILSHVWLFNNLDKTSTQKTMQVGEEFLDQTKYNMPKKLDDISCSRVQHSQTWRIYFSDQIVAELIQGTKIGSSVFLSTDTKFARKLNTT